MRDYASSNGTFYVHLPVFGNTYVVRNVEFDEVYALKEFYIKGGCRKKSYEEEEDNNILYTKPYILYNAHRKVSWLGKTAVPLHRQ